MFEKRTGFSLVELLVILAILAILGVIAIPTYVGYRNRARDEAGRSDCVVTRGGEIDFRSHHRGKNPANDFGYTPNKANLMACNIDVPEAHGANFPHGYQESTVLGKLVEVIVQVPAAALGPPATQFEVLCAHPDGNHAYCGTEVTMCYINCDPCTAATAQPCCIHDPNLTCPDVGCLTP